MKRNAFTLVEIIVSIGILSIVLLSITTIYLVSIKASSKSDLNRIIQENARNIFVDISKSVVENEIDGVSSDPTKLCNSSDVFSSGTKLCLSSGINYFLAIKDISGGFIRASNSLCKNINNTCYLVKNQDPLTNSLVSVYNLNFYYTNNFTKKITMSFELVPSKKSGIKNFNFENNDYIFQTTIQSKPF